MNTRPIPVQEDGLSKSKPRWLRKIGASVLALGVAVSGLVAGASAASASALTEPAFTSVSVVEEEGYVGSSVRVDVEGQVPSGASPGDTTVLQMPEYLRVASGTFPIKSPDGTEIGQAVASADGTQLVVTYGDYVGTHTEVSFSGWFTSAINDPDADGSSRDLVFVDAGREFRDSIITIPSTPTDKDYVYATGRWVDEDKGTVIPEDAIEWRFEAPIGNGSTHELTFHQRNLDIDDDGNIFATGDPAASALNCDSIEFYQYTADEHIQDWAGFEAVRAPLPASEYTVTGCGTDEITVEFAVAPDGVFYGATMKAAPNDTDTLLNFNAGVEGYSTSAGYTGYSIWNTLVSRTLEDLEGSGKSTVTPVAPTLDESEECGVEGTVVIPEVEGVVYSQSRDGNIVTVTAAPAEGYVFAKEATAEWTFDVSAEACPPFANPVAPTLDESEECGVEGTVVIPEVEGVVYSQSRDGNIVTVTAAPAEGYVFAKDATAEWTFDVSAEACPAPPAPAEPVLDVKKGAVTGDPLAATGASAPLLAGGIALLLLAAGAAAAAVRLKSRSKAGAEDALSAS
ncbi:Ig-like domain-containing protein [Leucobacter ruminantium]|uniref:LPXTG-motif cell wall anchor domain-containing protein n=1 Tax=Leucobacter ruminantium TaxID=1289170 RepID=A0A939RXH8_9MICO|nr:Ig-like domain-containing protein [Leucobacter ruminantium]MBO1806137.1 hypothetical protein [Leucobacter ruminantium]